MLVVINGFDHLDIVSRRKLTKYLIARESINILIETTNVTEVINFYPRRFTLEQQTLKEHKLDEQEEVRRLRRL